MKLRPREHPVKARAGHAGKLAPQHLHMPTSARRRPHERTPTRVRAARAVPCPRAWAPLRRAPTAPACARVLVHSARARAVAAARTFACADAAACPRANVHVCARARGLRYGLCMCGRVCESGRVCWCVRVRGCGCGRGRGRGCETDSACDTAARTSTPPAESSCAGAGISSYIAKLAGCPACSALSSRSFLRSYARCDACTRALHGAGGVPDCPCPQPAPKQCHSSFCHQTSIIFQTQQKKSFPISSELRLSCVFYKFTASISLVG